MLTVEVFLATMSTLVVAATAIFLWILSEFRAMRRDNKVEFQKVRDENREENQRTREELRKEIQRVLEVLYFHRHDSDGAAIFYPPTPTTPAPPAD